MSFDTEYLKRYKAKIDGGNLLTDSNVKVKAFLFSLPPIQSCLNCDSCKDTCYATKSYRQYPSAKALWDYNLYLAKYNLSLLEYRLRNELLAISKRKNKRVVRIHQSGDFISQAYIDMWCKLALEFSNIKFYAYTKVNKIFNFEQFNNLPNTNLIDSMLDGKYRNYGNISYVSRMVAKTKAFICPATYGENKDTIKCGVQCSACINKGTKVVFVQH